MRIVRIAAAAAVALAFASGVGAQEKDIVETAREAGSFKTLLAAVSAAGLESVLKGEGPYTVFAPTDEAFAAALGQLGLTQDELLADTEALRGILLYHVVDGEVPASEVVKLDDAVLAPPTG